MTYIPKKLYHITLKENEKSILKNGLKAQKGCITRATSPERVPEFCSEGVFTQDTTTGIFRWCAEQLEVRGFDVKLLKGNKAEIDRIEKNEGRKKAWEAYRKNIKDVFEELVKRCSLIQIQPKCIRKNQKLINPDPDMMRELFMTKKDIPPECLKAIDPRKHLARGLIWGIEASAINYEQPEIVYNDELDEELNYQMDNIIEKDLLEINNPKNNPRKTGNPTQYTKVDETTFNDEQKELLEYLRALPKDSHLVQFLKMGKFSPEKLSEEYKKEGYWNLDSDTIRAFLGGGHLLK